MASTMGQSLRMRQATRPRPFTNAARPTMRIARPLRAAEKQEVDLEAQVEMFMKRQAEIESGAAFVRTKDPELVLGKDVVDDQTAKTMCAEIFEVLRTLKTTRDMSVNEVKLVVSIEDPRMRERRSQGIEDERGVSRDEMASALQDVAEGRIPKDRIALKCLHEEVTQWPFLEAAAAAAGAAAGAGASSSGSSDAASASRPEPSKSDYESLLNGDTVVKPYIMGKEVRAGEKPQGIMDMLPDWVGYGALYGISAIPVLLVVGVVIILFINSLN